MPCRSIRTRLPVAGKWEANLHNLRRTALPCLVVNIIAMLYGLCGGEEMEKD